MVPTPPDVAPILAAGVLRHALALLALLAAPAILAGAVTLWRRLDRGGRVAYALALAYVLAALTT